MERFVTFIVIGLLFFAAAKAQETVSSDILSVGDAIPDFNLPTLSGDVSSASLTGKTTLLVFFATWCPPCRAELPHIQQEIWNQFSTNNHFRLYAIGREHTRDEMVQFAEQTKFTFPIVPDSARAIFSLFATQDIPRTYLIDRNGVIIRISKGFNEEEFAGMKELLTKELAK